MKSLVAPYRLLTKIILTNLWLIVRRTKLIVEKAQFMYVIVIDVPIEIVIQKALFNKKSSLPFGCLITKVAILTKVPLRDVKPIVKMCGKISIVIFVKFEAMVSMKRYLN